MGIYSNVEKNPNESTLGGIKYRILFASARSITTCPQLPAIPVTDEDYQIAVGAFVFATVGDGFNVIEAINRSGNLEWESVGNPGSLKSKLTVEFEVAGMQAALSRFTALAKNDILIMVLERTDCSGKRYLFGGCCLPAQIIKYKGGVGQRPEDDVKTTFTLEAYAVGLPIVLPDALVLPIAVDTFNILTEDDDNLMTEDGDNLVYQ